MTKQYTITSFNPDTKEIVVVFPGTTAHACIQLQRPYPATRQDLEFIIRQFSPYRDLPPEADLSYVADLVNQETEFLSPPPPPVPVQGEEQMAELTEADELERMGLRLFVEEILKEKGLV